MSNEQESEVDDGTFRCWCGATGDIEEMLDISVYRRGCGGGGVLYCECGGDQCVCHHHGEVECPGCEDCEDRDEFDEFDYDDEE